MYVSVETPADTDARLKRVIAAANFVEYANTYAFLECPATAFPLEWVETALALVRDDDVWSALVPSNDVAREQFRLFSFHFPPGLDNSGFVGWLATHLKRTVGTGVFVVCGQNSARGGIFDYWGAPVAVADQVFAEVARLRAP